MSHPVKSLRKKQTDAENWLWYQLRNRNLAGCKFRRQHQIGPFIVDFVCLEKWLVIELDGGQHSERVELDAKRSEYLKEKGFQVLRFWNHEVLKGGEAVLNAVLSHVTQKTPSPLPSPPSKGGEGR